MVSASSAAADKQSDPVRLAVVGLTHTHVHWIFESDKRESFEIVGIVEPNLDLARRYSQQHGFDMDRVYPTMDALLESVEPEGVTAFGTIFEHLEVVQTMAPRGIHVMVEKPLAVSLDHARQMQALAEQHGIHLLTNYETTWYPTNHRTREVLQSGDIGPLRKLIVRDGHKGPAKLGINSEFLDWLLDPEQNGAGALFDFGCYGANLATWLQGGQRPLSVTAVTQQLQPENNPRVDDEATIILTYPNAQAIIQASWNWPMGRKDMEVYGLTGAAYADNRHDFRVRIAEGYDGFKEESEKLPQRESPWHDPFVMFGAVIRGEIELPPDDLSSLENNMVVMEILEAARQSAASGQTIQLMP
ncbi:MAG: Gfo/Idh/MocA family oxidoreductase [Xanthomonadales bacterium]|nr:Gfo/Idh/MocA family oxidoreductase [Xanthomonadales bacterium]